jgi:glycosyltransferase involved in cell wall biosynthesis
MEDLVTIIMPVKNTSAYLYVCLESIIGQTYSNWELIAVDDGSTDDSLKVLREFGKRDSRIKVYLNEGSGIIQALRFAYRKSSGKFITRMDSDDIMNKDKIRVLSENLQKEGLGSVAIGLVKYFSDDGLGEGYRKYEKWLNSLTEKGASYEEIYKECVIPSPCWMVYRKDLDLCGAFDCDKYPEDYDLTFRFYKNGLTPIPCTEVLHYWRDYPNRTSRTHEHYADSTFMEIKTNYFLELDYQPEKKLVVWGAGSKGKYIAQRLKTEGIDFIWICDNPKKIGKHIYDHELLAFQELENVANPQSLITVANEFAQREIREYLKERNQTSMKDFYFFC